MTEKWDQRFMDLADIIANWSKETGKHVGAVIVGPNNEIRSTGYNGFPRGVEDTDPYRNSKEDDQKYLWSVHAETSAIYNAARMGTSIDACTLYCTHFPCTGCAKAIIQSGIKTLVTRKADMEDMRWAKEWDISLTMFDEAGIAVRYLDA